MHNYIHFYNDYDNTNDCHLYVMHISYSRVDTLQDYCAAKKDKLIKANASEEEMLRIAVVLQAEGNSKCKYHVSSLH